MKRLAFLMLLPVLAWGQLIKVVPNQTYNNSDYLQRYMNVGNTTTFINASTFTGVTDTTMGYDITPFKTIYVTLQSKDTSTILIAYQTSNDGQTWGSATTTAGAAGTVTVDSLKIRIDGSTTKSVDFTSVVLGSTYVRWIFTASAKAYALGTTTPTYSARYVFKLR